MPPAPRGERTSYGPSRLPAAITNHQSQITILVSCLLQPGSPVQDDNDRRRRSTFHSRVDEEALSVLRRSVGTVDTLDADNVGWANPKKGTRWARLEGFEPPDIHRHEIEARVQIEELFAVRAPG